MAPTTVKTGFKIAKADPNKSTNPAKGPPTKSANIVLIFTTTSWNFSEALLASNWLANSSLPSALASWANAAKSAFFSSWSDNWSEVIPKDFAKASCWRTFNLLKSVKSPTFLLISSAKVS